MKTEVPSDLLLATLQLVTDVAECNGLGCLCLPQRTIDGRDFPAMRCLQCRAQETSSRWKEKLP